MICILSSADEQLTNRHIIFFLIFTAAVCIRHTVIIAVTAAIRHAFGTAAITAAVTITIFI